MYQVQKKNHVNIKKINQNSDHAPVLPVYSNALWGHVTSVSLHKSAYSGKPWRMYFILYITQSGARLTGCSALYITFYLQALEQM